jgi:hypothetical protein
MVCALRSMNIANSIIECPSPRCGQSNGAICQFANPGDPFRPLCINRCKRAKGHSGLHDCLAHPDWKNRCASIDASVQKATQDYITAWLTQKRAENLKKREEQQMEKELTGSELGDGRSFESPNITFPKPSLRLSPRAPAEPPPLHLLPCPPAGPPQNILQLPLHLLPCELRDSHLRALAAKQYDELRRAETTTHPPSPASSDSDSDILLGYASDSETSSYCSWISRKCSAKTLRNVTRRKRKRKRSL